MAERLREAYKSLFQANEYSWKLEKPGLTAKLKSLTSAADDDPVLASIVGTFTALSKMADWGKAVPKKVDLAPTEAEKEKEPIVSDMRNRENETADTKLRLSYTINLNLPATTETEVFNAIFKSLRDNLLRD